MQCLMFLIFHVKFFFCSIVRKLLTWAKCETLTIFAKTPRKTDKYFPFAKSNLHENSFTHLRHFLIFLLFVFIDKLKILDANIKFIRVAFFYQSTNSDLEDVIAHSIIFGICFNSENMQLIMENFWVSANGLIENVWLPLS